MICRGPSCESRDDTHTAYREWHNFDKGFCSEECERDWNNEAVGDISMGKGSK